MPSDPLQPITAAPAQSSGPRAHTALHAEVVGRGSRVVLAHGFTQTGRVWGSLDAHLAADHEVVLVDMPGHGGSGAVRATLAQGSALLARAGGQAAYVGYSMGARFCLHLALSRPGLVDSLVLISGTAGIDDPDERRERRRSDAALAEELDPRGHGSPAPLPVERFLQQWLAQPMFDGIGPASGMQERLTNTGPGLASSLRLAGTGTQRPRWSSLHRLHMPVLVVTGARDARFGALGDRMVRAIGPNAVHEVVEGAGHAPHLEQPDAVARLVRAHLVRAHLPASGPGT